MPAVALECDQCGRRSIDPAEIPYDTTTGRPVCSPVLGREPGSILCRRCWWRLNARGRR